MKLLDFLIHAPATLRRFALTDLLAERPHELECVISLEEFGCWLLLEAVPATVGRAACKSHNRLGVELMLTKRMG